MEKKMLTLVGLLTVSIVFAAFVSITNDIDKYDGLLPDAYVKDYVKTIDKDAFKVDLAIRFNEEFDIIEKIDAHKSLDVIGYSYYVLYGTKSNQPFISLIKMAEGDFESESLSAVECPLGYCLSAPQWQIPCGGTPLGIKCGCINSIGGCDAW